MDKRLPVPSELQHLIEKREQEEDRRKGDHRSGKDQRTVDLGPLGAIESASELDDVPSEDRRRGRVRRQGNERRKKRRRKKG
jgi:hypothetical protein